jgi:hypothetical protein
VYPGAIVKEYHEYIGETTALLTMADPYTLGFHDIVNDGATRTMLLNRMPASDVPGACLAGMVAPIAPTKITRRCSTCPSTRRTLAESAAASTLVTARRYQKQSINLPLLVTDGPTLIDCLCVQVGYHTSRAWELGLYAPRSSHCGVILFYFLKCLLDFCSFKRESQETKLTMMTGEERSYA